MAKDIEIVTDIVPIEDVANMHISELVDTNPVVQAMTLDQIFQVIKRSVTSTDPYRLKELLDSATQLKESLEMTGQRDLLRSLRDKIATIGGEFNAFQKGFQFFIYRKDLEYIMDMINKNDDPNKRVSLTQLSKYQRLIPPCHAETVKLARDVFDNLEVLHIDPKRQQTKTEKKMQKDSDPILFGSFDNRGDKMFLIVSWEDKWCDFTLSELLDVMASIEPDPEKQKAINAIDIPRTVEDLVDAIEENAGLWKQKRINGELHDYRSSTNQNTISINWDATEYTTYTWST